MDEACHLAVPRNCPFPLPIQQQRKLTLSRGLGKKHLSQEVAELKIKPRAECPVDSWTLAVTDFSIFTLRSLVQDS